MGPIRLHPRREAHQLGRSPLLGGGVWINEHPHYPIPDLPPYAVRTPHIHGATAYGVTSSGLMMVMLVDIKNGEMASDFISVIHTEGSPMCNQLAPASL